MSDNQKVSPTELAEYLGLTDIRVHQLVAENVIEKVGRGIYDLKECVRKYCDYIRGVSRGSVSTKDEKQERTRYMSAKANLAELDHEERQGNLSKTDVIQTQDYTIATILKNNLQSIPDRQAAILAAETDPAKIHDILSGEVRNSLNDAIKAMAIQEVDDASLDITRRTAREILDGADTPQQDSDDE